METKKFIVYKSSAGSGKTHTLVREYLQLALGSETAYRSILAITFTNKAADEMKQRVLSYLEQLSKCASRLPAPDSMPGKLLKEISSNMQLAEEEVCKRAKIVLTDILHNYSDFSICTIDSFVHRIIETFAHDLYIPVNFEVEMDEDRLLDDAIDMLISNVGTDRQLTDLLVEFTEQKTDDERSWHIEDDIKKPAYSLLKEEGQIYLEKIRELRIEDFFEIIKKTGKVIKDFEKNVSSIGEKAVKLIRENNIGAEAFYYGDKGIGRYFANLANELFDKLEPNSYVGKTIDEDKWTGGKATPADKAAIDRIKVNLKDYYSHIQEIAEKEFGKYMLMKLISQNLYPIAVLNEIKKIIDDIKAENNIVHISEFNKTISGIVLKEPVPFIYERTGEKFKHFLIDEFQDTSTLQWHNLMPLIDNSLSENNFNMVVGDGKQAIYRWRNGDVEQSTSLPNITGDADSPFLREREQSLIRNFKEMNLDQNFRSQKVIVDFNNNLFSFIAQIIPAPFNSIYKDVLQKPTEEKKGGFISLEFISNEESEDSFDELNCKRAKELIGLLLKDDYNLKDIAILCRSNRNASKMAQYLLKEGIDVVSSESLLLSNSPVINFIIACLRYINSPEDKIVKYIIQSSNLSIQHSATTGLYDLCENIIRTNGLNEGREVNPSISFFLDAVHEFSIKNTDNISDFLEWWEEKKNELSLIIPAELNAVRIMTIHKAKGLQFPVVIYPFATERIKNTKDLLWVDVDEPEISRLRAALVKTGSSLEDTKYKELYLTETGKSILDMVNLLYVTLTRAEERVYVLSKPPGQNTEAMRSIPDMLAHYLKSIGLWEDGKKVYEFGRQEKKYKADKLLTTAPGRLDAIISNDWRKTITIKARSPEYWEVEDPDKSWESGNIIHSALSKIKYADDLDYVLNDLSIEGVLENDELKKFKEKISAVLSNPEIKAFFQKEDGVEIRTEAEILSKEGKIYRPDRLILKGKKCIIIDYKTGRPEEYHISQLNKYGELLNEAGYEVTEKFLVYTLENKVRSVVSQ